MGDVDGIPGCWVWPDPRAAVEAIWKVNQQMEDPFFSLSLCNSDCQINKIYLFCKESKKRRRDRKGGKERERKGERFNARVF